jgi:hypothetical protein
VETKAPIGRAAEYPPETKQLAVAMADRGEPAATIRAAVLEACGREPGAKNWSRVFAAWQKAVPT